MKEDGFTLIELIGTIVILSLTMIIIIPVVSKSMKKGVEDADKKATDGIIIAAQNYISDNGYINCVKVSDHLVNNGYLDEIPKRPSDNSFLNGVVKISKEIKGSTGFKKVKYTYTYATEC